MKYNTARSRFKEAPEEHTQESLTERAGYIPAKEQIENFMLSGRRLAEYRKEQYDYESEDQDDGESMDPTRSPNYDLADASRSLNAINSRQESEKKRKSRVKASDNGAEEQIPELVKSEVEKTE